jgi:hypothetical protein
MAHPFDRFDEVVLGDTEFISRSGELYEPVCVAWKELRSGRSGALRSTELGAAPPHPHDEKTLFVGFTAAEPEFYLSIGWPFRTAFLDLRVEHINLTNVAEKSAKETIEAGRPRKPKPRALIAILRSYGITDGDAAHKAVMIERIKQGPPFTAEEWRMILKYCFSDVLLLEKLLGELLPQIRHFDQALARGEYVKLTAEVFHVGQPADPWSADHLKKPATRRTLRLRVVCDPSLTHGLWDGSKLTQARLREFLVRHRIRNWRITATGKLGTANRDFEALASARPKDFTGLPEVDKSLRQLREFQMFAGSDNRYRTPIWGFSTITSRMAPNGSTYPFNTPAWGRSTMMAPPGRSLAYLDFSAMEFGVAAGQSRCETMLSDYHGEPYLILPILAGLEPPNATRHTHGEQRDRYKPLVLATQYGGGGGLWAHRLGIRKQQGQHVVDLHRNRYDGYWEWSDRKLQRAFDEGELVARDGWRCSVSSRTSIFTARNWLIQANAQAIFRYAGLMMRRLGITICALVHDAVLIEAEATRIDEAVALATFCLERAAQRFLHGLTLRVDAKIIREGERFNDKRGIPLWAFVNNTLCEIEKGIIDVSEADVA